MFHKKIVPVRRSNQPGTLRLSQNLKRRALIRANAAWKRLKAKEERMLIATPTQR